MRDSTTGCRVGVFGHYGHDNMGDEAIVEAVIQNLRSRWPAVQITGFSMDAADTSRRYGIPAYPIRRIGRNPQESARGTATSSPPPSGERTWGATVREYLKRVPLLRFAVDSARFLRRLPRALWYELAFLRDSYRITRNIDFLFVAGSGQFMDAFGGVWGYPYTLLKWTVLARCAGARVVFVSVGAGPIDSIWSRIMVRMALSLADYVSFRDPGSRRLIEWFGAGKKWRVYPDLAQSLAIEARPPADADRPSVGINPMAVYDSHYWYVRDDARYERYVGHLARFASRLIEERYPVFFFGTQPSDEAVIDDVIARLDIAARSAAAPERKKQSDTVSEALNVIRSADIVVATRFHGAVLALHAHRPVLGICYNSKTREVLRERGQEAYALDLEEVGHANLWRVFSALAANRSEEVGKIVRKGDEVRALLAEQYALILEILGAPGTRSAPATHRVH